MNKKGGAKIIIVVVIIIIVILAIIFLKAPTTGNIVQEADTTSEAIEETTQQETPEEEQTPTEETFSLYIMQQKDELLDGDKECQTKYKKDFSITHTDDKTCTSETTTTRENQETGMVNLKVKCICS